MTLVSPLVHSVFPRRVTFDLLIGLVGCLVWYCWSFLLLDQEGVISHLSVGQPGPSSNVWEYSASR